MPPPRDPAWSSPTQRPGDDLPVPLSLLDGVALVVWSLLGQLLVVSIMLLGLTLAGVDPTGLGGASLGAVTVVTQSLVLAGALAWLAGRGRLSWRILGAVRPAARHVGLGLVGGIAAFLLSGAIIVTADTLFGPLDEAGQALLETEMLTGTALVLTAVAATVLAPLLEELTFRGVLYQAVGRRTTWVVGAIVSSAVFAVVHVEVLLPLQLESIVFGLALFAVGGVFAVTFHRSRSLLAAVVAHATFNGVQIMLAASAPEQLLGFVAGGPGA
jgi:membrane protease YdiL (CAAX protease family)